MGSAVEHLMSNLTVGSFSKATELKKRIWFTLGALIVYRIGTYIPLPGIDPQILAEFSQRNAGGILSMLDMFTGGALSRMTIFALNIVPYISASIIMQLMTTISPQLEALKKEGESGRKKINQYTRYLTIVFSSVQAYALAVGLESMTGNSGISAVADPGLLFRFVVVVTLVGSTLFLVWLGEQITSRGIGNGTSLIIFAGIVANLPYGLVSILELGRTGAWSSLSIISFMALVVSVIAFVVFMESAHRRLLVQYPKRQVGQKVYGGESSHLPLKLNSSGVIPAIFASSLLLMPVTIIGFMSQAHEDSWFSVVASFLGHGKPLYIALYAFLIIFFAFFYTAIVFNPVETADNLKKNGGFIPGYRPGSHTAEYLDYVLTRLTTVGGLYLALICVLPEALMAHSAVSFYFGGTSILIVVSVTIDLFVQIQSHLIAHQYQKLIKKSRGRVKV